MSASEEDVIRDLKEAVSEHGQHLHQHDDDEGVNGDAPVVATNGVHADHHNGEHVNGVVEADEVDGGGHSKQAPEPADRAGPGESRQDDDDEEDDGDVEDKPSPSATPRAIIPNESASEEPSGTPSATPRATPSVVLSEVPSVVISEVSSEELPSDEEPSEKVPSVEVPSVEVPSVEVPSVEAPIVEVPSEEAPTEAPSKVPDHTSAPKPRDVRQEWLTQRQASQEMKREVEAQSRPVINKAALSTSVDEESVRAAYEDVRADTTDTEWAIFKYKNQTVVCSETGVGFDTFTTHFGDDERAFGFIRIQMGDEMSKRQKFVFLTWVGPQVSVIRRARMSIDKGTVKNIIKNFAMELQAESRAEIDADYIRAELARAGGANYGTGFRD